jgi:hypothetical protein
VLVKKLQQLVSLLEDDFAQGGVRKRPVPVARLGLRGGSQAGVAVFAFHDCSCWEEFRNGITPFAARKAPGFDPRCGTRVECRLRTPTNHNTETFMRPALAATFTRRFALVALAAALVACASTPPDAASVIARAEAVMGGAGLKSIRYAGTGTGSTYGQALCGRVRRGQRSTW